MTSPALPAELKVALEARLQGVARTEMAARAALISETYRGGGNSTTIRSEGDALAYALARMPATYAAVIASLNAFREVRPDFAPASLLDVGAGPGTATWAASEAFSSLNIFALIDANAALHELALGLADGSARLQNISYRQGEARAALANAQSADVVVASYVLGEIEDAERSALLDLMWAKTREALLMVEPGTPAGYQRIVASRDHLIRSGAFVAAPCPHERQCPLHPPDWCHFTQRLARSRVHMQAKSAELPYEDEKFSYVALTRSPATRRPGRVLAQPLVTKGAVTAKLCCSDGILNATAARREKTKYQHFKKLGWGDALFEVESDQAD
jgi:ribosomal protein RSM22 (predicted rRNA methylase)